MNTSLSGRVVAITGGARGIGYTIAKALVARGARVALSDIDEAALETAAAELGIQTYGPLDVVDADAFGAFLSRVEQELGPLDVLINNAGIMPTGPLLEQSDALTRRIVDINVLVTINGTKHALALMVPRRSGHVVNMASTMGEAAVPGLVVYNASKAATIAFSDATRLEFRKSGVHVSAILPGAVNTELAAGVQGPRGIKNIEPEDVAEAVLRTLQSAKSNPRVYVPRVAGVLMRSQRFLPRPLSEAVYRAFGAESAVLSRSDTASREAYLRRLQVPGGSR
jgi:NAD(P)-dependent dehydrogenase (short-subunit alcohol dehydrogenase family)